MGFSTREKSRKIKFECYTSSTDVLDSEEEFENDCNLTRKTWELYHFVQKRRASPSIRHYQNHVGNFHQGLTSVEISAIAYSSAW